MARILITRLHEDEVRPVIETVTVILNGDTLRDIFETAIGMTVALPKATIRKSLEDAFLFYGELIPEE